MEYDFIKRWMGDWGAMHCCVTVPLARSGGRRQDTTSRNHHVPQPIAYPFSSLLCALLDSSGEICVIGCVSRGQGHTCCIRDHVIFRDATLGFILRKINEIQ
jgi:hypothetical protein